MLREQLCVYVEVEPGLARFDARSQARPLGTGAAPAREACRIGGEHFVHPEFAFRDSDDGSDAAGLQPVLDRCKRRARLGVTEKHEERRQRGLEHVHRTPKSLLRAGLEAEVGEGFDGSGLEGVDRDVPAQRLLRELRGGASAEGGLAREVGACRGLNGCLYLLLALAAPRMGPSWDALPTRGHLTCSVHLAIGPDGFRQIGP